MWMINMEETRSEIDGICRNKIVFISWSPDEGTLVFVGGTAQIH